MEKNLSLSCLGETIGFLVGSIDAIEADVVAKISGNTNGFGTQLSSDEKPPPTRRGSTPTCA